MLDVKSVSFDRGCMKTADKCRYCTFTSLRLRHCLALDPCVGKSRPLKSSLLDSFLKRAISNELSFIQHSSGS